MIFRTSCDEYETVNTMIDPTMALVVTSDRESKRMEINYLEFNVENENQIPNSDENTYDYILDETQTFQKILGFGGAFTDSAAINIHSMNDEEMVKKIIESYYDPKGKVST